MGETGPESPRPSVLGELGPGHEFWVVPHRKIMYVSVAKNACTNLKWLVVGIAGEKVALNERRYPAFFMDHVVHNRQRWPTVLNLGQCSPELLREIHPDNGWFVFGAVRDPRSRLFSAWQEKLLLRNLLYAKWHAEPWYPRFPQRPEWIIEDFHRFVGFLGTDAGSEWYEKDPHFRPQARTLRCDRIDYTRVYDVRDVPQVASDLKHHLAHHGWSTDFPVRVARHVSPLHLHRAVFAGDVSHKVEQLYKEDFAQFGDRWGDATIGREDGWTITQIDEAHVRAALSFRAGQFRTDAQREKRQAEQLRRKIKLLKARNRRLKHRLARSGSSGRGVLHHKRIMRGARTMARRLVRHRGPRR